MRISISKTVGFTLIEVLIALAIIGIAFGGLAFVQITNLQATSTARLATDTKNAAGQVLEQVLADVLKTDVCDPVAAYCDSFGTSYAFNDYYWSCPNLITPSTGSLAVSTDRSQSCGGSRSIDSSSGHVVTVNYLIEGLAGIEGEGVLAITVTATHTLRDNLSVTVGDRVTCYDVYPTPTAGTPAPCPVPTSSGAGR